MSKAKSKEYVELQESYSKLQSKVQSKNSEIDQLISKINSLESKYSFPHSEFPKLPLTSIGSLQRSRQANWKPRILPGKSKNIRTTREGSTFWVLKSIV